MDIVLNTRFDSPNLPVIPLRGFHDGYDQPSADHLGLISGEDNPWQIIISTTVTWGPTGTGAVK